MSVNSKMTAIADAIRSKTGGVEALTLDQMATEINGIETGVELPELTTPADVTEVFSGKEYIDASGEKQMGTFSIDDELSAQDDLIAQIQSAVNSLPEAGGEAEPTLQNKTVTPTASSQTITADSGYDGLDTVTVNAIPSTYVKPTATKGATTYTPTTTNQTIASGTYLTGIQTIKGDANLVPANIVSGVSIFGIAGTASGGSSSGGGSIETVTGTVGASGPAIPGMPLSGTVHYVNANGAYATSNIIGTIIVMKDSILYANSGDGVSVSGNLVSLSFDGRESKSYRVVGDFTIKI